MRWNHPFLRDMGGGSGVLKGGAVNDGTDTAREWPDRGLILWREVGLLRQRRRFSAMLGLPLRPALSAGAAGVGDAWIGWGRRPSGLRAERLAERTGAGLLLLEDGFLRSFGLGRTGAPPLSLIVDDLGVHYDATRPSRLEHTLETGDFTAEELVTAERALDLLRRERLSKYNAGLPVTKNAFPPDEKRVLVVDQTAGDAGVEYGLAGPETFMRMLEAALEENPHATVYVKTHPDVLAGKRAGLLPRISHPRVRMLTENWHPADLLRHFGKVYVATSLMGLDALIAGCRVRCFGLPFYAGWGLTEDEQRCKRRTARRTLTELIAAAFIRHAVYLDPETGKRGDFFAVARHLARQRRALRFWAEAPGAPFSGRVYAFGFRYWKLAHVRPFFGPGVEVRFVRSAARARRLGISAHDRIAVWGFREPPEVRTLASDLGLRPVRVEDGFYRSVGLGADYVPPLSQVFDRRGIYFDPATESDLDHILDTGDFSREELEEAARLRERIARERLTKYNVQRTADPPPRPAGGRRVILVPGQVETDASILRGCGEVRTNLALLRAVRKENPDAFIIYKPHPDVLLSGRTGGDLSACAELADVVETRRDILSCIEAADEVHTMTSLAGFEALLRGKRVVTWGQPFYAGRGLTEDRAPRPSHRCREVSLDELVTATLIRYPRYVLNGEGLASAEAALALLARRKAHLPFWLRLPAWARKGLWAGYGILRTALRETGPQLHLLLEEIRHLDVGKKS